MGWVKGFSEVSFRVPFKIYIDDDEGAPNDPWELVDFIQGQVEGWEEGIEVIDFSKHDVYQCLVSEADWV